MLVLTRKKAETIRIGDNIVIKVMSTGRGKVKLGIDAPSDVRVLRGELSPVTRSPKSSRSVKPGQAEQRMLAESARPIA